MRLVRNIFTDTILSRLVIILLVVMLNSAMACSEEDVGKSCIGLSDNKLEGTSSSKKQV